MAKKAPKSAPKSAPKASAAAVPPGSAGSGGTDQIVLIGYIEKKASKGLRRLHLIPDFRAYLDIPTDDVTLEKPVDPTVPNGPSVVEIKPTTRASFGVDPKAVAKKGSRFAVGDITETYLDRIATIHESVSDLKNFLLVSRRKYDCDDEK
jgi:hypothetical protein